MTKNKQIEKLISEILEIATLRDKNYIIGLLSGMLMMMKKRNEKK